MVKKNLPLHLWVMTASGLMRLNSYAGRRWLSRTARENKFSYEVKPSTFEGNLRAKDLSKIEKTLQVPEVKELVTTLSNITERAGFYLHSLCNILNELSLQLNSNKSKDFNSLVDLLFLHDFLLSHDVFWGQLQGQFYLCLNKQRTIDPSVLTTTNGYIILTYEAVSQLQFKDDSIHPGFPI